jgi:hypothetical protein
MPMTITKTEQKDLAKGEELMSNYAALKKKWNALTDSIKDELTEYARQMDAIEKELLALGESKRHLFVDDNLKFEEGYLHISNNSFVKLGKKFDLTSFNNAYPEMVDVQKALKLAPIKKAFLDADERKLIKALYVEIDTKESMKVIPKTE